MTFVISKIEIVSIRFADVVSALALFVVPADEINRIIKVISISPSAPRGFLISSPGWVDGLGITIRARGSAARDKAQDLLPSRFGSRLER